VRPAGDAVHVLEDDCVAVRLCSTGRRFVVSTWRAPIASMSYSPKTLIGPDVLELQRAKSSLTGTERKETFEVRDVTSDLSVRP